MKLCIPVLVCLSVVVTACGATSSELEQSSSASTTSFRPSAASLRKLQATTNIVERPFTFEDRLKEGLANE